MYVLVFEKRKLFFKRPTFAGVVQIFVGQLANGDKKIRKHVVS